MPSPITYLTFDGARETLAEINDGFDLTHEGKSIRSVVLYA